MIKETLMIWLQEALKWLAEPGASQIDYLKNRGVWPNTDELALELDDVAGLLPEAVGRGEVSIDVELAVKRVEEKLDEMSGQQNAHLWTPEALANSPQWETVRSLASEALEKLKVDI
jgi:hypothetical protein